jgi:ATP phosphoribosyltransferase regulatory subunit HisZ
VEARFVSTLEDAGFAEVVLPIIDFAEPYAGITPRRIAKQSYRFTDREGELVAIRSDFTPMLARALAPMIESSSRRVDESARGEDSDPRRLDESTTRRLPLRVFYRGDVIRCDTTRLGANRELFQIGAELIGDASVAADLEILRLAASLASAFCEQPLVVYADGPPLDDPRFVLHDDDGDRGYYTGIRFWVYGDDRRTQIAQGGRYDTMYGRFGTDAPAIGFTFTIDDLTADPSSGLRPPSTTDSPSPREAERGWREAPGEEQ